jgi:hypothetical protein
MKITIDDNILEKYNLSVNEFVVLWFNSRDGDYKECMESLISKGIADRNVLDDTKIVISNNTKDLVSGIIIDSDKNVENKDSWFNNLANKLRELYPKGRKSGTTYMWRDSTAVIAKKLKTLVAKYGYTFTEEEAITATKAYIQSFNGDYRYMQLLKYFILKSVNNPSGDVEIKSEFMSYIENAGQEDSLGDDWTAELR